MKKLTTMKKRIITAVAITLISGSVALAQDNTQRKTKVIPIVTEAAPASVEAKRANVKMNRKTKEAESTKLLSENEPMRFQGLST